MQILREIAKKILPKPMLEWYRRRRAVRQYLRELGYEIYDRTVRLELEDVEGRIAARREGFYGRLVQDVLERTELILQELDRRIEAVNARHGNEIRELRGEVRALRESIAAADNGAVKKPTRRRSTAKSGAKLSSLPTSSVDR
ncbi:MAG: hypothetical protein ABR518_07860 [Actinomycetota bacterium]